MTVIDGRDSVGILQLKECYGLAAQCVKSDAARKMLTERAERINVPSPGQVPVQAGDSHYKSEMQVISKAMHELSVEGFTDAVYYEISNIDEINALPGFAEKYFLLAILALRSGSGVRQRMEALVHITTAVRYSPNDPRYIALANILQTAD